MPIVRPVLREDLERVLDFVTSNLGGDKEKRRLKFSSPWSARTGKFGYLLECEATQKPVGYLGCIYAMQPIAGHLRMSANMTDWVVVPEHRKSSLLLLKALLSEKDTLITNFSASDLVAKVLLQFGFKFLDDGEWVFRWGAQLPSLLRGPWPVVRFIGSVDEVDAGLRQVVRDHTELGAIALTVNGQLAIFIKKPLRQGQGFKLLYAQDPQVVGRHIAHLHWHLALKRHTPSLTIDKRFIDATAGFRTYEKKIRMFYRGEGVSPHDISGLYSEWAFRFANPTSV